MRRLFMISILSLVLTQIYGQEQEIVFGEKKIKAHFGAGWSQAVGAFADENAVSTFTKFSSLEQGLYRGWTKRGNGYAANGRYFQFGLSLTMKTNWSFSLHFIQTTNEMRSLRIDPLKVFNEFVSYRFFPDEIPWRSEQFNFAGNAYQVSHLMPGVGYRFSAGPVSIQVSQKLGLATMSLPSYIIQTGERTPAQPSGAGELTHENSKHSVTSFSIGWDASLSVPIGKRISLGYQFGYLTSDFQYETSIFIETEPSVQRTLNDQINYRVLNHGFVVDFLFNRNKK